MSDNGINWYVLIYPAIAIPIAVLGILRWRSIRKRQIQQQLEQMQRQGANNANNGLPALDFIMGNPYSTSHSSTVYNVEHPPVHPNTNAVDQSTQEVFMHDTKRPQEEPPSMIQSKRWFWTVLELIIFPYSCWKKVIYSCHITFNKLKVNI